MKKDEPQQKLFSGVLAAHGRLGVHELRNALYPESNIAQGHSEYGMWAAPTPSMITSAIEKDVQQDVQKADDVPSQSILNERLQQAERSSRDQRERDDRDVEKE